MFAMAFNLINFLFILFTFRAVSEARVYTVGDFAGWTTIGNIDYRQWAATKTFDVGDTIRFQYNPRFHNVMQVTHSHYRSCNTSHPIATHTSGDDSISIATSGHHFYICGVPGHCQSGQRVDINIINNVSSQSGLHPSAVAPAPSGTTKYNRPIILIGVGFLLVIISSLIFN